MWYSFATSWKVKSKWTASPALSSSSSATFCTQWPSSGPNMYPFNYLQLIHTPASLSLNLNYRLIALLLLLLFFDYEMLVYSYELLYAENPTHFIFIYYTVIISLSIIEPVVKYFFDFYQKYTLCHIANIDEKLALLSLWISVPRLLIQIFLSICLAFKFSIFFYLIFTII